MSKASDNTGSKALRNRIRSMSQDEIIALWRERQASARDAGLPYYTVLIDPVTGKRIAEMR